VIFYSGISYGEANPVITIDGILDEAQWRNASTIGEFVTVSPFTQAQPEYQTKAKIYSDQTGIYIGITNSQPAATHISERTPGDSEIIADSNGIVIDFDHKGLGAYSFQVGLGGSTRDGIWRDENDYSDEWDGSWTVKTVASDSGWIAEVFIPWDVATMVRTDTDQRTVGLYIFREVAHLSKRYGSSAIDYDRQRFLSVLPPKHISDFASGSLQLFASATSRMDLVTDRDSHDAGFDLFWKPDSSKQLSLTVNPDFGHVDSDQLVVNFSPTESFFAENRAFFTENQALFDLQGPEDLRLIHTRRIGGSPDIGNALGADIATALKFTSIDDAFSFGLFSALEKSDDSADGRDYFAGRLVRKTEDYSIGYLLTYTDRPDIDRDATVQALDYSYNLSASAKLTGQLIHSASGDSTGNRSGQGSWLRYQQQLSAHWDQLLQISYFGDQLELNDLGFLPRNNLKIIDYSLNWQILDFADSSPVKERKLELSLEYRENTQGQRLPSDLVFRDYWYFNSTKYLQLKLAWYSEGVDDLITRDNNRLDIDSGGELEAMYFSNSTEAYRYHILAGRYRQQGRGDGRRFHFHPSYHFNDNYVLSLGSWYIDSKNWLLWQQHNEVNSYRQRQIIANLHFDATISERHELSFKLEWIALQGEGDKAYSVQRSGRLLTTGNAQDFSLSDTAVQLRYRYELGPLSNIYLVYSRGGRATLDHDSSFSSLFSPGWDARDGDNILFKIRYQF